MIGLILLWWLVVSAIGLAAMPLAWRIFDRLPDRAFGLARPLGLLLSGYLLWLGASTGVLRNSAGGALAALIGVAAASAYLMRGRWSEFKGWLLDNRIRLLAMEVLFLLAFIGWAIVRADNPDIAGTEKPMELAFLNAILRSDRFPPLDPWLSGYAISYYYFGYVLLALLARLTATPGALAFNLGNALWFAMAIQGGYALLYDLLARYRPGRTGLAAPLLGPLFVFITGNLEGLLEVLHARHLFWRQVDGRMVSSFWSWIGLQDLESPPFLDPSWMPSRHWWWWRASRVIRDLDLAGNPIGNQSIDEFPFFSFLLADNHPHLLAIPFVLIAVAFGYQILLAARRMPIRLGGGLQPSGFRRRMAPYAGVIFILIAAWQGYAAAAEADPGGLVAAILRATLLTLVLSGVGYVFVSYLIGGLPSLLSTAEFWTAALLFGALAFLNAWDFPIYLGLLAAVLLWRGRALAGNELFKAGAATGLSLIVAAVLLFLPWYPSFSSQAGGILPHLFQPTRFLHFLMMFGPSLVPIVVWLVIQLRLDFKGAELRRLIMLAIGVPLGLLIVSWLLALAIAGMGLFGGEALGLESVMGALGVEGTREAVMATLRVRLLGSWTALTLGFILASVIILLRRNWADAAGDGNEGRTSVHVFILLMIAIGTLLIMGPEFLYLRDQFGVRMNTIFKFYFAAWILWSLAAAFIVAQVFSHRERRWLPLQAVAILPLLVGLVYPVLAVWTKTEGFRPAAGSTLDGSRYISRFNPSDYDAIQWMNANLEPGVIAEAVGGSYTYYERFSVHTGFATVLGWPGHESQWRGSLEPQGTREEDLRLLYQSPDWSATQDILDRYNIAYVIVGSLEREAYRPVFENKFDAFMNLVYANDGVKIYARK